MEEQLELELNLKKEVWVIGHFYNLDFKFVVTKNYLFPNRTLMPKSDYDSKVWELGYYPKRDYFYRCSNRKNICFTLDEVKKRKNEIITEEILQKEQEIKKLKKLKEEINAPRN